MVEEEDPSHQGNPPLATTMYFYFFGCSFDLFNLEAWKKKKTIGVDKKRCTSFVKTLED